MPSKIIIKKKTEIKTQIVYRDYPNMSQKECIEKLFCYDTAKPTLDGQMDGNIFKANAALCDRKWERDFELASHEKGNWRVSVGIGVGAFILGAVLGGTAGYYMPRQQGGR